MKIAVVGAGGFIGRNLIDALEFNEYQVSKIYHHDPFDFSGIDLVYHVAGVTGGGALLQSDPLAMVGNNVRVALDVFDAALKYQVPHVVAMSSTTGYPSVNRPLLEDDYFDGDVYPAYNNPGETRRFIEKLGRMYPFDLTFIRCAGAYGPHDDFEPATSHVIGATIRKVAERQDPIVCWGDGQDVRDGLYISDLVNALILASSVKGKESINIGIGNGMSIKDMITCLTEHAGYNPTVVYDTTKPRMIKSRVLDVNKARVLMGWKSTISMQEGLCKTLDWYNESL